MYIGHHYVILLHRHTGPKLWYVRLGLTSALDGVRPPDNQAVQSHGKKDNGMRMNREAAPSTGMMVACLLCQHMFPSSNNKKSLDTACEWSPGTVGQWDRQHAEATSTGSILFPPTA